MDAGAFVAYWHEKDDAHEAVKGVMEELRSKPLRPVTIRLVIAEAVTGLARFVTVRHAIRVGREIEGWAARRLQILEPSGEDYARALELMERCDEPSLTYQDCVAFSIMRRLRIRLAFTTDRRHFGGLGGFTVVP